MQSDCAASHSALPYAGLRGAAVLGQDAGAMTAEILVTDEARPAGMTTPPLHGGTAVQTPDLATVITRIQGGLGGNLYSAGTAMMPVRAMLAGGPAAG
ncbi:uncharacterized protein [Triticum aestivum]|uniref:uncharacterized protein n=1 Tax=Triticum aestivum TaxID=4565 RepID=UPI001D02E1F2|nr:uncharacterized protein LOC123157642 [Triticum aestivum]